MPPRLARLLAVLGAVALVAAALVLRGALAGDDEETARTDDAPAGADLGDLRLVCDSDLGDAVCDAAAALPGVEGVEVLTFDEIVAGVIGDPPLADRNWDLWLTVAPMPGVLDTARLQAGLDAIADDEPIVLASSRLALLARSDALPEGCEAAAPSWPCLTESVRPPVAVPGETTSLGVVTVAAGAAGLLDGDIDFGIGAYEGTEESAQLRAILADSPSNDDAAAQTAAMVRPGTAAAVVTTEGLATRIRATAQGQVLDVLALTPPVTVGVVLVGLGERGPDAVSHVARAVRDEPMRDALVDEGWGGAPMPTTGLPADDVVFALREELG